MSVLVDSYSESNLDYQYDLKSCHPSADSLISSVGHSFSGDSSYILNEAKFYLKKVGSPTGTIRAVLYSEKLSYYYSISQNSFEKTETPAQNTP